jgi:hypothetical protein
MSFGEFNGSFNLNIGKRGSPPNREECAWSSVIPPLSVQGGRLGLGLMELSKAPYLKSC